MERVDYPLPVLHEYDMTAEQVLEHAAWLSQTEPKEIAALPGVSANRAPVLPLAGRLLRHLVEALQPGDVMVSGFGLREGVCLENMPGALRGRDPLMAACAKQETVRSRAPGFGAELADWVVQVVPPVDAAEERLVRATARLVDVNWRAHPDYRVTGCWEAVTRTTVTDAGHAGRAFMGMVLAARYKRARLALEVSELPRLLGEAERKRALCFGSAFRLGAVLCGSTPGLLGDCAVERSPDRLDLVLGETAAEFIGEEVEKRFGQLLRELKVVGELRIGTWD
jgi:exopolyphosphatase/guanosine-5'-triphosphate,3'-diphosphate pyrophosphatase